MLAGRTERRRVFKVLPAGVSVLESGESGGVGMWVVGG